MDNVYKHITSRRAERHWHKSASCSFIRISSVLVHFWQIGTGIKSIWVPLREPELLFFLQHIKTNVDITKRDKKDRDSSFVTRSAALPKDLVSVTELQSRFFWSFGFVSAQGSFPYPLGHACGGSYLCINSLNCLKLVSGSLPCTSFRYRHDPHHHHTWALLSGVIPDTSWWGREVLLSLFWDRELRYWWLKITKGIFSRTVTWNRVPALAPALQGLCHWIILLLSTPPVF